MSGIDFLMDTNIFVYVLEGNSAVKGITQCSAAASVITEMELLGRKDLSSREENFIRELLQDCEVFPLTDTINANDELKTLFSPYFSNKTTLVARIIPPKSTLLPYFALN